MDDLSAVVDGREHATKREGSAGPDRVEDQGTGRQTIEEMPPVRAYSQTHTTVIMHSLFALRTIHNEKKHKSITWTTPALNTGPWAKKIQPCCLLPGVEPSRYSPIGNSGTLRTN